MRQGRFIAGSRDFAALRDYISEFYAGRRIYIIGQCIYAGKHAITQTRVRRIKNGWRFEEHKPEDIAL